MQFDEILKHLGEFGTYQKRIYLLLCLPSITAAYLTLSTVFTLYVAPHRCSVPGLQNDTYDISNDVHGRLVNHTIPVNDDGTWKQCKIFVRGDEPWGDNSSETSCTGWVYDHTAFLSTITEDLDLVCDDKTFRSHANMLVMAGELVGSLVQSVISDVFGRKKALMGSLLLLITSGFLNFIIQDKVSLLVVRFITGCSTTAVYMSGFVIGVEMVGPSKRVFTGMVIVFFWVLGMFAMSLVAYFVRQWNYMILTLACPPVLFLSYWWLIPESARWLLSKGRKDDAKAVIEKAAAVNRVVLPENLVDNISVEDKAPRGKLSELYTNPTLLRRSIILIYMWAVCNLTYFGLTLNVSNLSGNVILNFVLSGVVEFAGYFFAMIFLDKLGRKVVQSASFFIGGLACVVTIFPALYAKDSAGWLMILLSLIGKMGSSGAFAVIYLYTAELYPTAVRNVGVGVSSMFSRVGGAVAPYIADLALVVNGDLGTALPLIIFGGTAVLAGLLTLCLPETRNMKLPETVDDLKNIKTAHKYMANGDSSLQKKSTIDVSVITLNQTKL